MKRAIIILCLVVAIFALATIETLHVNQSFAHLEEEYATLQPLLQQNEKNTNVPECLIKVEELASLWQKKKRLFSVYIPHNSLVELNLKVTRLVATVKCNDQKMALIELEDLISTFPEYNTRYFPTIYNIL